MKSLLWSSNRRIDSLLQAITTFIARRRLVRSGPIEVLVDTSVLAAAVLHETRWVSTGKQKWGNVMFDAGYAARVPVRKRPAKESAEHEHRDFEDACYLTGIARLAHLGLIKLRSSGELHVEQWVKPAGMLSGYSIFDRSAFEGIDIPLIDGMPDMVMGPKWMNLPSLTDQQRERLDKSEDELYLGLLRRLGKKCSQDAWHIRTAETAGMYCFLTADHRLIRNMAAQEKHEPIRSLRTKVLSPTQLGKALGLFPLDPRFVSYEGASGPVRADLHMPGSKRRKRRQRPPA